MGASLKFSDVLQAIQVPAEMVGVGLNNQQSGLTSNRVGIVINTLGMKSPEFMAAFAAVMGETRARRAAVEKLVKRRGGAEPKTHAAGRVVRTASGRRPAANALAREIASGGGRDSH